MDAWVPGAKVAWNIGWLYHVATTAIKVSILLFHRRIVGGLVSRKIQFVSWFSLVFVGAYGIAFLVLPLIQCRPIQASWRQYDMTYRATAKFHCASIQKMWNVSVAISVCSVFTDFVSATIPVLWFLTTDMQLRKSERYGLVAVFAIGYLTVGAGIAKAAFIGQAIDAGFIDKTWPGYNAYIAGTLEGNAAIACASAPAMYKCCKHFFARASSADENLDKSSSESKIESPGAPAPQMSEVADTQVAEMADPQVVSMGNSFSKMA